MRVLLAFFLAGPAMFAAYQNPIVAADGRSVYVQVATGPATTSWYAVRGPGVVEPVARPLADVAAGGTVRAWAQSLPRYCGFAGSTCWLADWCQGSFGIDGASPGANGSGFDTFVRLSPQGSAAWIEQASCHTVGWSGAPAPLSGLYDAGTLGLMRAAGSAKLAVRGFGRRAVTSSGRALTLTGPQLQWVDASGVHPIRNVNGAVEAVTDESGSNVVYVEGYTNELHWVTGPDWLGARDRDLGLRGRSPALTPDGGALLFLGDDGSLRIYEPDGGVRTLAMDCTDFAVGAGAAFAVMADGRLVRIELSGGVAEEWLAPFPAIRAIDAAERMSVPQLCPLVCYGTPDSGKFVDRGEIVVVHGDGSALAGWRARIAGKEAALETLSESAAWFQVPEDLPESGDAQTLEFVHPAHPLRYSVGITLKTGIPVCLGIAHQDFTRAVGPGDPAVAGEIVHVFVTGMRLPADPPRLAQPEAFEVVWFGAAPGLSGMQQLDLRVLSPASVVFAYDTVQCGQ